MPLKNYRDIRKFAQLSECFNQHMMKLRNTRQSEILAKNCGVLSSAVCRTHRRVIIVPFPYRYIWKNDRMRKSSVLPQKFHSMQEPASTLWASSLGDCVRKVFSLCCKETQQDRMSKCKLSNVSWKSWKNPVHTKVAGSHHARIDLKVKHAWWATYVGKTPRL